MSRYVELLIKKFCGDFIFTKGLANKNTVAINDEFED